MIVLSWLILQIKNHWHVAVPVAILLLLLIGVGIQNRCSKPAKLSEAQIQKSQDAIAVQDRQKMQEVLIESDVNEKQIDDNLQDAKTQRIEAINEAKKKADGMTNQEIQDELERRAKQ